MSSARPRHFVYPGPQGETRAARKCLGHGREGTESGVVSASTFPFSLNRVFQICRARQRHSTARVGATQGQCAKRPTCLKSQAACRPDNRTTSEQLRLCRMRVSRTPLPGGSSIRAMWSSLRPVRTTPVASRSVMARSTSSRCAKVGWTPPRQENRPSTSSSRQRWRPRQPEPDTGKVIEGMFWIVDALQNSAT